MVLDASRNKDVHPAASREDPLIARANPYR
jgi:hypothetical protein